MAEQLLFDEPVDTAGRPILLPIQQDLLERGRAAYLGGARRVIWQAPCGSGKTVIAAEQTRLALEKSATILHIVHRRRLVDQMIGTLARFGIYAAPIMEGRSTWKSDVYCASRDTLLAMLKGGMELPRVSLIVPDECHTGCKEVMGWYLKNCPSAYWTGYTATPVRPNGGSMAPPYQTLVCMKPASELIRIGRLCSVKVYDPKSVKEKRKRGEPTKPVGNPVDHWRKYADGMASVVFAANVADSIATCQLYNAAGITAEHIDALTPDGEREAVFERSENGQTKVICNCGVLVEGVDLPWLVCCQILRGCNSLVLWVQACGRVMRSFPGKTHGIILDHSGAVYDFGPPDSDYQWSLVDGATNEKANKLPKDRKPICCPRCSFVFMGKPACPECGTVIPKKRRKSILEDIRPGDGVLTEFSAEQSDAIRRGMLQRLWTKYVHIARAKGWAMNRVAGMFSGQAKCAPWEAGLATPIPSGIEWKMSASDWLQMKR